jgi:hypothetical protein
MAGFLLKVNKDGRSFDLHEGEVDFKELGQEKSLLLGGLF